MKKELVIALRMTLATLVLTGLAYPLAVTGLAQVLFPRRANGSLVSARGTVVGSELIGQGFKSPAYFQPRPSAAGTDGYDAATLGVEPGPHVAEAARPRRGGRRRACGRRTRRRRPGCPPSWSRRPRAGSTRT